MSNSGRRISKTVLAILSVAIILGGFFTYAMLFSGFKIPGIIIDEEIEGPTGKRDIEGHMSYDMTIRYADGSKQVFTKNIQLPDFVFSPGSLFSDSSKSKEIIGIDVRARSEMQMPTGEKLAGVSNNVNYAGKIEVLLNNTTIFEKNFADQFTLAELDEVQDLYTVTVTPSQLTGLTKSGVYVLSYRVQDDFTFTVDSVSRVLSVKSTPSLYYKDLQPLYAVVSTATVKVDLERLPQVDPNWGDVVSYKSYIAVTAKGFKPSTGILFDYNVPNTGSTSGNSLFASNALDKTINSDASGSATDKVLVKDSFSYPKCYHYYGWITVSDGTTSIGPIKLGCRNIHDDSPGILF